MSEVFTVMEQGPYYLYLKVERDGNQARVILQGDARTKDLSGWVTPTAAKKVFDAEKARIESDRS